MVFGRFKVGVLVVLASACAGASETAGGPPNFSRDIAPILSDNCYECHGPDEAAREADLRLDQRADLSRVAGDDADESELLRRIRSRDPDEVMPPPGRGRKLSSAQQDMLARWINNGAKWESHWALTRPLAPPLPRVANGHQVDNPIDMFVQARLATRSLRLAPQAEGPRLLRRVTLDLTGLPPSETELDAFASDSTPAAYERVVDRLLASPRFGERMSMDWLDASRYADTNGYQGDRERTMWPWRDWVVKAFNQGIGYDQFTLWQLAGDLLPSPSQDQVVATGFCRNHMINGEGGRIAEENRVEYIFDQIETLGTVWMGLTVGCCRCHDHKFDPITQREYFQLFAFFNQTPVGGGGGDPQMAPAIPVPTALQARTLADLEDRLASQAAALSRWEAKLPAAQEKGLAAALQVAPSARNDDQWKTVLAGLEKRPQGVALAGAYRALASERDALRRSLPKVMVMQDRPQEKWRDTFILNKGLYNQRREQVTAGTPAALPSLRAEKKDRLALARWLVSAEHPLTARVTVNRIWQQFFGTGLVRTTEDFGIQGEKPSHPQLLDWLATEFVRRDWDVKWLVREIVTSRTYRQSAKASPELVARDPGNRWLARGPRRRMPAWMIRDHALAASGLLAARIGGPPVHPYQPPGVWEEASFGRKKYRQDHGESLYRRSLYVFWRRIVGPTLFFDTAKRQTCSVRKTATNTPLHALVTMNDTTYVEAARGLAGQLLRIPGNDRERLARAYRRITSRSPSERALTRLADRLVQLRRHYRDNAAAAEQLIQFGELAPMADANPSDLAAYTTVLLTLLNLDEALTK